MNDEPQSKGYSIRKQLADLIILAGIGWTEDTILIKRQGDLQNDVATALAASQHGAILHIFESGGKKSEDEDLESDLTLSLTIITPPQLQPGNRPEEDLKEELMDLVHDLRLNPLHPKLYRFQYQNHLSVDIKADGGSEYSGIQIDFLYRLSIPRKITKPNGPY